jgi:hypothetical protein
MELLNDIIDKALSGFQEIKVVHLDEHLLLFDWMAIHCLLSHIVGGHSSQSFLVFLDVVVGTFVTFLDISTEIDG